MKGKDFIFWKERKKEEMKKVQWELGWRGEREIKQTEVLTFLFYFRLKKKWARPKRKGGVYVKRGV